MLKIPVWVKVVLKGNLENDRINVCGAYSCNYLGLLFWQFDPLWVRGTGLWPRQAEKGQSAYSWLFYIYGTGPHCPQV